MDPNDFQLVLFDHGNLRPLLLRPADKPSSHWIGGDFSDYGFRCTHDATRLIYAIDQTEDFVPQWIPDLEIIPLCYGFGAVYIDHGLFTYRIVDNQITPIRPADEKIEFPYEGYPRTFQRLPLELVPSDVDLTNGADAINYVGIFGLGHLDNVQFQVAVDSFVGSFPDPREIEEWNERDLPIEEFVHHLESPFWQERPTSDCLAPDCRAVGAMKTIALLHNHPHPNVRIWNRDSAEAYVQLIFQVCSDCACVTVSNQSD